tara:strand:+ start:423 stop:689 length:267 start_codon:yes stop_codon:yes gene_type:complete
MDELRIDEELLNECLREVSMGGDNQHRGIKGLLEMLAMAGYRWRTPVKVVLFNGDMEADLDEEYNAYLDRKACGENITWAGHDAEMKK